MASPELGHFSTGPLSSPVEIIHQGWLIKSPPLEKQKPGHSILRPQWRRRWFVLQQNGDQYILSYYEDEKLRKRRGFIDLSQCTQVDRGLNDSNGKQAYKYMFDIRTPTRIYYLAAERADDMNTWVSLVCNACGLRDEDEEYGTKKDLDSDIDAGFTTLDLSEQKRNANNPHISSPYIHISTCYTGGRPKGLNNNSEISPAPLSLANSARVAPSGNFDPSARKSSAPTADMDLSNYDMGDDSVFLPTESQAPMDGPNFKPSFPPGRPPKPAHLAQPPSASVSQVDGRVRREIYANAGEMEDIYRKEMTATASSQTPVSSIVPYPPSVTPLVSEDNNNPPPLVDRELKPGRTHHPKAATLGSNAFRKVDRHHSREQSRFLTMGPASKMAPPVPRALKPRNAAVSEMDLSRGLRFHQHFHSVDFSSSDDWTSNSDRKHSLPDNDNESEEQIYFYLPSVESSGKFPTMIPASNYEHSSVAYIDLDLPPPKSGSISSQDDFRDRARTETANDASTAYKKIDFMKTKAFNDTRQTVEQKYKDQS